MEHIARKLSYPNMSVSLIARDLGISKNSMYKVVRSGDKLCRLVFWLATGEVSARGESE